MGPLSISVLLFTALVLSGGFAAPRAQEQREKSVIFERPVGNTSAPARCPSGWRLYKSRCFHFVSQSASWSRAQIHCTHLRGSLASIHSLEEYHFVQNITRGSGTNSPVAWIGGTDAVQRKIWLWIDGTPFDFTKWAPGQPDDAWFHKENCLEMNFGDHKLWNNAYCTNSNPSVCAKQAS